MGLSSILFSVLPILMPRKLEGSADLNTTNWVWDREDSKRILSARLESDWRTCRLVHGNWRAHITRLFSPCEKKHDSDRLPAISLNLGFSFCFQFFSEKKSSSHTPQTKKRYPTKHYLTESCPQWFANKDDIPSTIE